MLYVRFTNEPQKDLERGYSFAGYEMYESKEKAIEQFSQYEDDLEGKVAQDNVTGLWGRRLSGLCGFSVESMDEVESIIAEETNYKRTFAVVYEGVDSWDSDFDGGDDEGARFTPKAIVNVIELWEKSR